jgi:RNA polymerase sigma-70 factor, ECF subfamily
VGAVRESWSEPWHDEGVDDRALIDALRAGDRQAFTVLVQHETGPVYRAALRILGRPAEAEDVTREAFVAAFRAMRSYRGEGSVRAWLFRIATRLAFRRLAQRRDAIAIDTIEEPALADRSSEPARQALAAERDAEVRRAIVGLPEPYRETIALRFLAELSLAEVAEATGRPH